MPKVKKKKHYDDPIKEDYRAACLDVGLEHEKEMGKARDWKVVTLMGESLEEYEQVWAPLDVRPGNITVVENNLGVIDRLRRKMAKKGIKGFNIVQADVLDYIMNTDGKYHFIHLDTESTFSPKVYEMVAYIAGRQRLADKSILGLNVVAKRENDSTKNMIRAAVAHRSNILGDSPANFLPAVVSNGATKVLREPALDILINVLRRGRSNVDLNDIYDRDPNKEKIVKIFNKYRENSRGLLSEISKAIGESSDVGFELPQKNGIRNIDIDSIFQKSLLNYLKNEGSEFEPLAYLMAASKSGPYFVRKVHAFKYIGEGKTTMLSNFYFLDQFPEVLEKYEPIADRVFLEPVENILNAGKDDENRKFFKSVTNDYLEITRSANQAPAERKDLGSSAGRPEIKDEDEYRSLIIKALKEKKGGFDLDEFKKELRKEYKNDTYSLDSLGAWYTMRNKNKARITKPIARSLVEHEWTDDEISRFFLYEERAKWRVRGYRARRTKELNSRNREENTQPQGNAYVTPAK